MKTYMNRSLLMIVTLSFFAGACSDYRALKNKVIAHTSKDTDVRNAPHVNDKEEARLKDKWDRLLQPLGFEPKGVTSMKELENHIRNNPSRLINPKNSADDKGQYNKLLGMLKAKLKENSKKMRCGGITSFTRLQDAEGTSVTIHESDVFQMVYRDQETDLLRTALVILPETNTK